MFNYDWKLSDGYPAPGIEKHGLKVFSCFACGGGSTMGYKLAGYDVIGFNEIDPKMAECYIANHNPKFRYIEPIQEFKTRDDLPEELFNLDILDGSPPCSSFSMAGNREKDWGKKKKFREGQQEQVLDTLFFDFLDVADKLQPKVILAENVKGLLLGNAADFLGAVMRRFKAIGYSAAYRLLDASKMGVPQRRQRVFIYAVRSDLLKHLETCDLFGFEPTLDLAFHEPGIKFKYLSDDIDEIVNLPKVAGKLWYKCLPGNSLSTVPESNGNFFNDIKVSKNEVLPTLASQNKIYHSDIPRRLNPKEYFLGSSFPTDYNTVNTKAFYLCGMSVPPVMTAQIAHRIKEQWFDKF